MKDIFNTKSYPTQMGSILWKNFTPGNNARVVDSLLSAGGVVAGKTVTAEFAVHALNETRNPHDLTKSPGTSSSGSAVSVALGMVPYSLATQTAGSIIRPASYCGVWGMKPSFGMIPRTGTLKTTDTLDTIGFITSHGRNLKPILDSIRVTGPDYPYVYKNIDSCQCIDKNRNKKIRIGFIKTHLWSSAKSYVQSNILSLVEKINNEDGYEVEEIETPSELFSVHDVHQNIYVKSLSYYFENESKYYDSISDTMKKMINSGLSITPEKFKYSLKKQEEYCDVVDKIFSSFDAVISIATAESAPKREQEELDDPSLIWTLTHVPSITAPVFRDIDGMPFGVQFTAKKWGDYRLIECVEDLILRGIIPSSSQPIL